MPFSISANSHWSLPGPPTQTIAQSATTRLQRRLVLRPSQRAALPSCSMPALPVVAAPWPRFKLTVRASRWGSGLPAGGPAPSATATERWGFATGKAGRLGAFNLRRVGCGAPGQTVPWARGAEPGRKVRTGDHAPGHLGCQSRGSAWQWPRVRPHCRHPRTQRGTVTDRHVPARVRKPTTGKEDHDAEPAWLLRPRPASARAHWHITTMRHVDFKFEDSGRIRFSHHWH
jgi:hypothetical protein